MVHGKDTQKTGAETMIHTILYYEEQQKRTKQEIPNSIKRSAEYWKEMLIEPSNK